MEGSIQLQCQHCGGGVESHDRFCSACGKPIQPEEKGFIIVKKQEAQVDQTSPSEGKPMAGWAKAFVVTEQLVVVVLPPVLILIFWLNGTSLKKLSMVIVAWVLTLGSNPWQNCDERWVRRRIIGYTVIFTALLIVLFLVASV